MLACESQLMPDPADKGRPSSAPLSVEDADRLADSFTPFWEDSGAPVASGGEPAPTPNPGAVTAPMPAVEAARKPLGKQTLLGIAPLVIERPPSTPQATPIPPAIAPTQPLPPRRQSPRPQPRPQSPRPQSPRPQVPSPNPRRPRQSSRPNPPLPQQPLTSRPYSATLTQQLAPVCRLRSRVHRWHRRRFSSQRPRSQATRSPTPRRTRPAPQPW